MSNAGPVAGWGQRQPLTAATYNRLTESLSLGAKGRATGASSLPKSPCPAPTLGFLGPVSQTLCARTAQLTGVGLGADLGRELQGEAVNLSPGGSGPVSTPLFFPSLGTGPGCQMF